MAKRLTLKAMDKQLQEQAKRLDAVVECNGMGHDWGKGATKHGSPTVGVAVVCGSSTDMGCFAAHRICVRCRVMEMETFPITRRGAKKMRGFMLGK